MDGARANARTLVFFVLGAAGLSELEQLFGPVSEKTSV